MKTQRINTAKLQTSIDVENFDNVTSSNLNLVIVKSQKAKKSTEQKSAVCELLDSVNYEKSTKLTKAIKSIDFLFSSIRSIILALIANNKSLNVFDTSAIVLTLRKSKKDNDLYSLLRSISAFSYKAVKTKVNEVTMINIVKAFSVASITKAVDFYNQIDSVRLTNQLVNDIKHEHELNAVAKVKKQIETLQTEANRLTNLIEKLVDSAKTEKNELNDKLTIVSNQLIEKTKIFEYVQHASNRSLIK